MKKLLCSILLLFAAGTANAQFAPGAVLKASDLNAALAAPTITGGSINNAPIGQNTPATGRFTTLQIGSGASSFNADGSIGLAAGTKLGLSSTTAFGNNFVRYNSANNGLQIDSNGATIFTNGVSNTERARIDSSGNLIVGGTTAFAKLHIYSNGFANTVRADGPTNSGNNYLSFYGANAVRQGYVGMGGGSADDTFYISNDRNAPITIATNGSERARVDASGSLGIGTTAPGARLDVASGSTSLNTLFESTATTTEVAFSASGTGTSARVGITNNDLYVKTTGTERMRIDSGGNVGIGTSTPQARLSLGITSPAAGKKVLSYDGGSGAAQSGLGTDMSGNTNELTLFAGNSLAGTGRISFGQLNTTSGAYTQLMTMNTSGQFGIGIGAPDQKLTIASGSDATNANDGVSFYGSSANKQAAILSYNTGGFNADLRFYTKSSGSPSTAVTEAMRLDQNGKMIVAGGSINLGAQKTPATSSATCATGDMQVDASYIYVCTTTNTWKRAALATF